MADDYGAGSFFPDVFQNGVPDIQPALHEMLSGPRVVRRDDGKVAILHLDDVLEVTKRRDVHSMDPEVVEARGCVHGCGPTVDPTDARR